MLHVRGVERRIRGFVGENLRERDHLGDPEVDGRIILNGSQDVVCGGMDWLELTQNGESWRALVNAVMNLWVP
jgi:hypothetical protein